MPAAIETTHLYRITSDSLDAFPPVAAAVQESRVQTPAVVPAPMTARATVVPDSVTSNTLAECGAFDRDTRRRLGLSFAALHAMSKLERTPVPRGRATSVCPHQHVERDCFSGGQWMVPSEARDDSLVDQNLDLDAFRRLGERVKIGS